MSILVTNHKEYDQIKFDYVFKRIKNKYIWDDSGPVFLMQNSKYLYRNKDGYAIWTEIDCMNDYNFWWYFEWSDDIMGWYIVSHFWKYLIDNDGKSFILINKKMKDASDFLFVTDFEEEQEEDPSFIGSILRIVFFPIYVLFWSKTRTSD